MLHVCATTRYVQQRQDQTVKQFGSRSARHNFEPSLDLAYCFSGYQRLNATFTVVPIKSYSGAILCLQLQSKK